MNEKRVFYLMSCERKTCLLSLMYPPDRYKNMHVHRMHLLFLTCSLLVYNRCRSLRRRRYTRELAEGDESIAASWKRVREGLHLTLSSLGLDGVGRVKASEQRDLQRVLDKEIPSLRRQAAPVQFSFFGTTSKKMD